MEYVNLSLNNRFLVGIVLCDDHSHPVHEVMCYPVSVAQWTRYVSEDHGYSGRKF
jgi:hypothetical protein